MCLECYRSKPNSQKVHQTRIGKNSPLFVDQNTNILFLTNAKYIHKFYDAILMLTDPWKSVMVHI